MSKQRVDWSGIQQMLDIMAHAYRCAKLDEELPFTGYRVSLKRSGLHQGIVLEGEEGVIVAVCGSNQLRDWTRINADMRPVRRSGRPGRWHAGFARAGDVVGDWLPDRRYFLVGHSMGAAAVLNAASDLHPERLRGCLLIDPPRACWGDRAANFIGSKLPGNSLRLVAGASLVAHIPPRSLRFRHPPDGLLRTFEITLDGRVIDRRRTGREWLADVWAARKIDGLQLVRDHVIPGIRNLVTAAQAAGDHP